MTRKILSLQKEGRTLHMLVATPPNAPDKFRDYMGQKGVPIVVGNQEGPIYLTDYEQAGLGGLRIAYQGPGRVPFEHQGSTIYVGVGTVIVVSGVQKDEVEKETDVILRYMGEVDDEASVQYMISRLTK